MDRALIDLAGSYPFINLWYNWTIRYADEMSKLHHTGIGYRAGVFRLGGSKYGEHHDDWPAFFDSFAIQGVSYTGINALWSYLHAPSFKIYWDTGGKDFVFP